uniref:Uncharacterized protein n=1 Tax=Caenorhabditis japonica TaxID=281687 RepID=A0A8R1EHD1_CAEJA
MSNKEETHKSTKAVPNGEEGMVVSATGDEEDVAMEGVMEDHEPAGLAALGSVQEAETSQHESAENNGEHFPIVADNHPMALWYGGFGDGELPREPAKRAVCQVTSNFGSHRRRKERSDLASVVRSLCKTWVFSPAKLEYCGQDRVDLSYLLLKENAVDDKAGKHLEPVGLFLGDVIIVTSVYRRPQFNDWSSRVPPIDEAKNAFFAVKTFTKKEQLVFGKMIDVKKQGKGWYAADIMVPATQPAQLLRYVRKGGSHQHVIKATEAVQDSPSIRPRDACCLTSAPMAFANVHPSEEFPSYAQAYSASLGIYGIVAVSTRNEESRHFVAKLVRMERGRAHRVTCEMNLEMVEQATHPNLWPKELVDRPFHTCAHSSMRADTNGPSLSRAAENSPLIISLIYALSHRNFPPRSLRYLFHPSTNAHSRFFPKPCLS